MGIKDWFGIGDVVAKPIEAIGDLYTTDKARLEAEKNIQAELNKPILAQLDNNNAMVKSPVFFEAAWPAMIGWTSGFLVLLYYAPQIIIATYVWGSHCVHTGVVSPFPMTPHDVLNLVYLLFGFGTYHFAKNKWIK